jgi:phospholipid/cholesterol/gamma-HCH transport system permease protein
MEAAQESFSLLLYSKKLFGYIGNFIRFAARFFRYLFKRPFEGNELLLQCFKTGYQSLPLIGITAFIMGLVMTMQSRPSLAKFGAESLLPGIVAFSIVKEIGPVITALVCAGKISSRIGAELGSMRVTEQIDAMEVSGINPYKFLVVSRTVTTTLMVPILTIFADAIAMISSFIAVNIHGDISFQRFFRLAMNPIDFVDIFPALIKSVLFGFVIGMIGCYKGYYTTEGTAGVGKAANSAVVAASLTIFVIDFITVQFTDLL